ncbi:terminase family protein [Sphingomonas sp. SM33]|uniref:Terminase family protein n=1 Tax=Sphingomonas telluris TaxID=2907998 RepID=A0ABS9VMN2_9SPHN|nr:terminase family protein [Sphingomonas telluris]MCH8615963.1 terminase family protein [Sphingomonas telluris]
MRELMLQLAKAPIEEAIRIIGAMSPPDILRLDACFEAWAHESQLPPKSEGWRVWLLMAGRGFGKTRAGAEWVHALAGAKPGVRIALVGATMHDARNVMVEGVSGLLRVAKLHGVRLSWEPSLGRLKWRNGSEAQIFSGENADGLRGPEHDFAWADELAKWSQADAAWDNLQMGLRRGSRARVLVTTTPRPGPLLERIKKDKWTVTTTGRTSENLNLDRRFVEVMTATYGGTRLGRQELDGELIADVEGALWPRDLIECSRADRPAGFERIVVGVDPPAGAGAESDACGIVVAGRSQGRLYVIADESCQGLSPDGWARRVAGAVTRWDADMVVAEANNGGAMVGSVLGAAEIGVRVKLVHASRGKVARADPIALRFESGRAYFAGRFPALEDELAGLSLGGGYEGPTRSPDRADAMVWALTELGETRSGIPRVRAL